MAEQENVPEAILEKKQTKTLKRFLCALFVEKQLLNFPPLSDWQILLMECDAVIIHNEEEIRAVPGKPHKC